MFSSRFILTCEYVKPLDWVNPDAIPKILSNKISNWIQI